MRVFQHLVHFSEEVINQQSEMNTGFPFFRFFTILLNRGEDSGWNALVFDVAVVFV